MRWFGILTTVAIGVFSEADLATTRLENPSLSITLTPDTGSLVQITDRALSQAFMATEATASLWQVELMDGSVVEPESATRTSCAVQEDDAHGVLMTWSGFGIERAPDFRVEVRITMVAEEPVSRWRIAIRGIGNIAPRRIIFPRLGSLSEQPGETLAVPQWIGEVTTQARTMLNPASGESRRREWEYPGTLSMQFLTVYGDHAGLLLSADDTALKAKRFAVFGGGSLGMEVSHLVPLGQKAQDNFEPGYDVLLQTFDGDWYTAAALYREWAIKQWWVEQSRVRTGQVPDWVRDTGLWVWNRGPSPGVLGPAIALQQYSDLPVSVFWHWWHGCAYDVGFPEYLPPREGAEPFREAVADAQTHGINAIVYMNQRLWGMTTESWKERDAARYAVKQPDGSIAPEVYNTFVKAPNASMCMGTEFWRDTYATLAGEVVCDLGVSGIYMDQACSSLACYDTSHGHPLGGGTYWMEGFKALESDIRDRCAKVKEVGLAGEGCGEAWLPHLDMMLSLQVSLERYAAPGMWEPVPLFNAVYHDVSTQYGNYSSLTRPPYDELWPEEFAPKEPLALLDRKFAAQFRLEHARSFVWGQHPSLANFRENQLTERAEELDFLLRIARLRRAALKYLRDGVFLQPPQIDAPMIEIPISRLSIYAGQQDAVQEYMKSVPAVLASAWLAEDGSVGVVLANISDAPQAVKTTLPSEDYPVADRGTVYRIRSEGREETARYREGLAALDVELEPRDVRVYEIAKESP
ncbi:MAG: putative glycoside hydrolase [Candidatus Hydrogenedentota bacterium]